MESTREHEWFVPSRGPRRLRLFIGLTFYPYSLMNASYIVLGSMLAPSVHLERAGGMALVYLLAVGISAHALDATGPNKPWGSLLSDRQLYALAAAGLVPALSLGAYYAVSYAPLLALVGSLELFFLLAYNLELFGSRFHSDFWFATSWGFLPVIAGYVVQTGTVTPLSLAGGLFGFSTAYVEISASRPYKVLRRSQSSLDHEIAKRLESVLKGIVASALAAAIFLSVLRFA